MLDHYKQTKALVEKAAALIDSRGKAAFSEFRIKGSEWFHGDTYLFAYDLNANVLLNPAFPAREGTNVHGQKDANGKLFHDAMIRTAETTGSGWVDYMFLIPGQTEPSHKWTYVKAVTIDGVSGLVGSASIRSRVGLAALRCHLLQLSRKSPFSRLTA
ncbi:cache domain-containing protein [Caballeronia arvi]|uniref:cache domain-containing protein n=1 Tax=Caballeronia arvi TaxID=1777135 RepID=UPI001F43CE97|nr:cache domain-containing protein [Caballeronia arvi]